MTETHATRINNLGNDFLTRTGDSSYIDNKKNTYRLYCDAMSECESIRPFLSYVRHRPEQ